FTQYQTNTSLLNTYNNSIIELSTGVTQNDENQIDCNSSLEWTACFTQDQTNTSLLNIYNAQHCEEQINTLQHDIKSVKKNEHPVSLVSRRKRKINPKCKKCNLRKHYYDINLNLCKDCYGASIRILSGNKLIDDFIESTQTFYKNCRNRSKLEFIPYKQFTNIEYLAKGGISVIYKAKWVDDLHYFLNKSTLPWLGKLQLLHRISIGLNLVHKNKIIHRDLYSGNILINCYYDKSMIADLGISKPINELSDKNAIYGVIPYVAPKVLKGGKFTQASDIYSFGMIIWEVISGCRPFSDRKHDEYLILDILNDLIELMETCWHQDLEKRKFANLEKRKLTIQEKASLDWYKLNELKAELKVEQRNDGLANALNKLIKKADKGEIKFPENIDTSILPTKINDQAIYSSRPLTQLISKALTLQ
ncbi:9606_t:CDS:2, partial [Racocetra fulgida]